MLWLLLLSSSKNKVFVRDTRVKRCACEQCGHEFEYEIEREAGGKDNSLFSWDERDAFRKAEADAQKNVSKLLDAQDDAVPCPDCGWVQTGMIVAVRRQSYLRLKEVFELGMFLTITGVILPLLLAALFLFTSSVNSGVHGDMTFTLLSVAGILAVVGGVPTFLLWLLRHLLNAAYNPNANPKARG